MTETIVKQIIIIWLLSFLNHQKPTNFTSK